MVWLLLTLAHAEAPLALQAVWATEEPYRLRNEGVFRLESGDYEGARDRFLYLDAQGDLGAEPAYYLGLTAELQRDFSTAVAHYTHVIETWPEGEHAKNARFRRALCFEDLGRHDDSIDDVESLAGIGAWSPADHAALDMEIAFNRYVARHSARNERRLDEAIAEGANTDANPWLRAKALDARVDGKLDEADDIGLSGNARARRHLQERATLLTESEEDIKAIAKLDQAEFVLRSLARLGDAYLSLHEAMITAKPPHKFGPDKRAIYEAEVKARAQVLVEKAWHYYDDGLQCALRVQWGGPETAELKKRRDAIARPATWTARPTP